VRQKLSPRFRALSVFLMSKTCASRVLDLFSGVIYFFFREKSCGRSCRFASRCCRLFLCRKRALREFSTFFRALSTFFPARNRGAEVFASLSGVVSFFNVGNARFESSRPFFGRYLLFFPREIVGQKFSPRFRALSAFFMTKTCASKVLAFFSALTTFFLREKSCGRS